jgi:hypothetical protein
LADPDAPRGGGKALPLRPTTIDDGEIRLGPARLEPLTADQEAQAVELLTALFAAALRRQRSSTRLFSIVHPCYRGHVEIVTDYLLDHRYLKRLPTDWLPAHAYRRPLGTYVDQLAQAGFRIERVVEVHHATSDAGGVPGLLYARAVQA